MNKESIIGWGFIGLIILGIFLYIGLVEWADNERDEAAANLKNKLKIMMPDKDIKIVSTRGVEDFESEVLITEGIISQKVIVNHKK